MLVGSRRRAAVRGLDCSAVARRPRRRRPFHSGPYPPPGDKPHRYVFAVHALEVPRIDVPANATAAMVGFNLNANALAKGTLTARYGR